MAYDINILAAPHYNYYMVYPYSIYHESNITNIIYKSFKFLKSVIAKFVAAAAKASSKTPTIKGSSSSSSSSSSSQGVPGVVVVFLPVGEVSIMR